jgi:hypothetical protein
MGWRTSRKSWSRVQDEADLEAPLDAGSANGDGHLERQRVGAPRAGRR